jgi:hypothetical protein
MLEPQAATHGGEQTPPEFNFRVGTIDEECIGESMTSKRKEGVRGSKKRVRLDSGEDVAWGETGSAEEEERRGSFTLP